LFHAASVIPAGFTSFASAFAAEAFGASLVAVSAASAEPAASAKIEVVIRATSFFMDGLQ
jgi:hypothetical protein